MMFIALELSVKSEPWREADPSAMVDDFLFQKNRQFLIDCSIDDQGGLACSGCGNKTWVSGTHTSGFFEVHHRNDNHQDQSLSNLVVLCPFCHQVFHFGFACMLGRAHLIYCPEVSQYLINKMAFEAALVFSLKEDSGFDVATMEYIREVWEFLMSRIKSANDFLGACGGIDVANALLYLSRNHAALYQHRSALLEGWRLIPDIEHHELQPSIRYWGQFSKGYRLNAVKNATK